MQFLIIHSANFRKEIKINERDEIVGPTIIIDFGRAE